MNQSFIEEAEDSPVPPVGKSQDRVLRQTLRSVNEDVFKGQLSFPHKHNGAKGISKERKTPLQKHSLRSFYEAMEERMMEERLRLLDTQRELAAIRCQGFTDKLEAELKQPRRVTGCHASTLSQTACPAYDSLAPQAVSMQEYKHACARDASSVNRQTTTLEQGSFISGKGAHKSASMEDLLEERLCLLETQREVAAVRCQGFTDMLEAELEDAVVVRIGNVPGLSSNMKWQTGDGSPLPAKGGIPRVPGRRVPPDDAGYTLGKQPVNSSGGRMRRSTKIHSSCSDLIELDSTQKTGPKRQEHDGKNARKCYPRSESQE